MRLSETGGGLSITYSPWLGGLLLVLGIALAVHLVRRRAPAGRTFGVAASALLLICAGSYLLAYKAVLTQEGGRVYALLRQDDRFEWRDVESAAQEERTGGRGGPSTFLVLKLATGDSLDISVNGLSYADRNRVLTYVGERLRK